MDYTGHEEKTYHPEFLTATILNWIPLLANDDLKKVIVDCLSWLVKQKRCTVYAFVIMPNHIHLIWKINDGYQRQEVQGALLSYTAHQFKNKLSGGELTQYMVNDADRAYQFWERNCMVKECWGEYFLEQKLDYLHHNPLQLHWQLSETPEEYYWSSASYYFNETSHFDFITHYKEG